ncbi:MAG TPA: hypothetical protein VG867_04840 [Rhizomicrobium sp.]|nr:hypothetical protein [Rhizomicrobium sp.]
MKYRVLMGIALAAALSAPAFADNDLSPADKKAMHDYVLSMDKVKAMGAALDDFKKMEKADPSLEKQANHMGDDSKSIAEMEAKVASNPKMMAVYRAHGLTPADAVVMPFVLMYAGMIVEYPSAGAKLSEETSPQQIAFFKQNEKALKATDWLYPKN